MLTVIKTIFYFGPLLFGLGFIAPLAAQILERLETPLPFGLTPLIAGLILGAAWGTYAQIKGRWA
jgi:hypothetical protein